MAKGYKFSLEKLLEIRQDKERRKQRENLLRVKKLRLTQKMNLTI